MALASRVEGASPHALVAMLYDELALALDVWARAQTQQDRAVSILHALQSGLDASGGELASSLASIYAQMQRRLILARGGDMLALAEVREGLANLCEAWAKIA